jgi:hypothetical protein
MGLFGRKKKDLVFEGITGTAVIRALVETSPDVGDDSTTLSDFGYGNVKFRMELEVQVDDGRAPYTVTGKFKMPTRLTGWVGVDTSIPVYVDPDDLQRVELNWDGFDAGPGAPPSLDNVRTQVHNGFPAENRKMMIDGWVTATQRGAMTPEQFDESVEGMVTSGVLTADEAAAARAAIKGEQP